MIVLKQYINIVRKEFKIDRSDIKRSDYGVPQGSVLGPSDLPDNILYKEFVYWRCLYCC